MFANAQSNTYQSEENNICGSVQLSPVRTSAKGGKKTTIAKKPDCRNLQLSRCRLLYDSGAFTDVLTNSRVTSEQALVRQLETLSQMHEKPQWCALSSYDRLIDEKYINGTPKKERWSVDQAWLAVEQTVEAAKYLDSQRQYLKDFVLVQSCQGVDADQYRDCVLRVLEYCQPQDILGLGGWCILGKQKRWLPVFHQTIQAIMPLVAGAGIRRVHIFGCTWYKPHQGFYPPLVSLLWLCDCYGIKVSTDSRSLIGNALWKDWRRAGATLPYWRHNLAWVKAEIATLRDTESYQKTSFATLETKTQLSLFEEVAS